MIPKPNTPFNNSHIGGGYAKDMENTFLDAAAAVQQSHPEVSIAKLNLYRRDGESRKKPLFDSSDSHSP